MDKLIKWNNYYSSKYQNQIMYAIAIIQLLIVVLLVSFVVLSTLGIINWLTNLLVKIVFRG